MSTVVQRAASKVGGRAPRVPFAVLLVGLIAGAMALLLALNTASAANEVTRHDAALKDLEVNAQMVQLQNQIAASAAPANIAAVARSLGMVPAGNPAFLRVDAHGKVKLLGSAAPAAAPYTAPPVVAAAPVVPAPPATPAPTAPAPTSAAAATTAAATTAATTVAAPTSAIVPVAPTAPAPSSTPPDVLIGGPR